MPTFKEAREAYRTTQAKVSQTKTEMIGFGEAAKSLERDGMAALRGIPAGEQTAAQQKLNRETEQLTHKRDEFATILRDATRLRDEALRDFATLVEPEDAVKELDDGTPVLLYPLRLETRYGKTSGAVNAVRQLWVRVYPDDVLVDSFQPEISLAEYLNSRLYWISAWRAAGDETLLRAAWKALARAHGPGRANWLLAQIAPLNPEDAPPKPDDTHHLILQPQIALQLDENEVIAVFWERVWLSGGVEWEAAFADLTAKLGTERAAIVGRSLIPANLDDSEVAPDAVAGVKLVILHLPQQGDLPLSQGDWTRGARVTEMPERLVLLGFRDGLQVLREVGAPIPPDLPVGPDPALADTEQVTADGADLDGAAVTDWTTDFRTAVAKGMGFVVDLPPESAAQRFDRLFVLGVRAADTPEEGAAATDALIAHHQASRNGFTILRQGQATNNTDSAKAGYSWWEDLDAAYDHYLDGTALGPEGWRNRSDGAWMAGLLGLDPAGLQASPGYHLTEQAEARAMNTALWPATLGYYMDQMMEPVFSDATRIRTRDFFTRHVIGRGPLPLFRVGRMPYGILPATAWSRLEFWKDEGFKRAATTTGLPDAGFLSDLNDVLRVAYALWSSVADQVPQVSDPGLDPQQRLLDIVGLHPNSVEFYQRYSQNFTQYYNLSEFSPEPVSEPLTAQGRRYIQAGLLALSEFGWTMPRAGELPEVLEKIFLKEPNLLKGDLVASGLSETELLASTRADGDTYLGWLAKAARADHDTLRRQAGFDGGAPRELLYLMLHHALDLGYVNTALDLRRDALGWDEVTFREERKEPTFVAVAENAAVESRWAPLYRAEPAIAGAADIELGAYIPTILSDERLFLRRQIEAVEMLRDTPTARLERALVEHVDCLSYRLDAWRLGLQAVQLSYMRGEDDAGFGKAGLYTGAYGWVENLAPDSDTRTRVDLDPELAQVFDPAGDSSVFADTGNLGHIHAPSQDHATTAAVLRNGYLANATPAAPDLLAVDLSSERVRLAQQVLEGLRNGQSLGALLGYLLERHLHDEPDLFLDRLIYDLRRHFPLTGNRMLRTRVAGLRDIRKVEARNVIDGLALANYVAKSGDDSYPYGLPDLPPLTEFVAAGTPNAAGIGALIDAHVAMIRNIGDAVADLSIAEGVYQVVRGNYDRAAGSLDAFSKGLYPPEVEVTATPRTGRSLTHRVALHLAGGQSVAAGAPRLIGEPALADWIASQLPSLDRIFARVTWLNGDGSAGTETPSMAGLGLTAIDIFYLVDTGGERDMAGLDDLLIDFAERSGSPPPHHDATFALAFHPDAVAAPEMTLFQAAPLIRALRGLILGARPLRPTDMVGPNDTVKTEDAVMMVRPDKAQAVRGALSGTGAPVDDFIATLTPLIGVGTDPVAARDAAVAQIDGWMHDFAAVVRQVHPFGLRATGLTSAVEGRRRPYQLLSALLGEIEKRLAGKAADYQTADTDYVALPGGTPVPERQAALLRAFRIVSTEIVDPSPADLPAYEALVAAKKADFDTLRGSFAALRTAHPSLGGLYAATVAALLQLGQIDLKTFDLGPVRDAIVALASDLLGQAERLRRDIATRLAAADKALAAATTPAGDAAQKQVEVAVRAILGEAFIVLPEFLLDPARKTEWSSAWADKDQTLQHLSIAPDATSFPLDDWLHGIARVRVKMQHLEMTQLLSEILGAPGSPELHALQFPYRADDVWLGAEFPPTFRDGMPFTLDGDHLLYTILEGVGAGIPHANPAQTVTGLLLDEWSEVIPGNTETTGLTFHYDRPNTEAPQAVLLVTPPRQTGAWNWGDIVDAMHESLDFARTRAVEPDQLAVTALGPLIPVVLSTISTFPITAALNFAENSGLSLVMEGLQDV